jgi:hypothetical protein
MKNIYFIVLAVLVIIYIISSVRKNQLSIKTSFGWIIASLIMLFLAIFPYSLDWLAEMLGISYPPALFLTLCVVYLVIQNFNFSKKLATQQEKIADLAQEVSILKSKDKK